MKKFLSLLSAIAILMNVTACSESAVESSPEVAEELSEEVEIRQKIYKETKIPLAAQIEEPFCIKQMSDRFLFFYKNTDNEVRLYTLDSDLNVISDTKLCDSLFGFAVYVTDDGDFYSVSAKTDFEFEYDEYGEISNYRDFQNDGTATFSLTHYDSSCNVISEEEITGFQKEFDMSQSQIKELCPYGEGKFLLSIGNGLSVIGTDGSLIDSIHYDMQLVDIGLDADGKVIASMYHGFAYMDGETPELPESLLGEYEERLEIKGHAQPGDGIFKAYLECKDGIYGIMENGEIVQVFDFPSSLLNISDVSLFISCGDGKFLTANTYSSELCLYTRRPDDFTDDREVVDIWYISGGDSGQGAVEFSKSSDKYIAKVNRNIKQPDDIIRAAITGEVPDVIEHGDSDLFHKLINLGALADLNELMDTYGYISRDELMPNVLEALDMDGKMYAIPEFFSVYTLQPLQ